MNEAHEGAECLLTSQGDPAEAFEFVKETFDLMALLVEPPVDWPGYRAAWIGLDLCGCAKFIGDEAA